MRKALFAVILATLVLTALLRPPLTGQLLAQTQAAKPQPPEPKVKVGDMAPDFTLKYFDGHELKPVSLRDYRGKKNVVVAFYIFAFTGG